MWHSECLKLLSIKLILVSAATAVDCGDGSFSVSEDVWDLKWSWQFGLVLDHQTCSCNTGMCDVYRHVNRLAM